MFNWRASVLLARGAQVLKELNVKRGEKANVVSHPLVHNYRLVTGPVHPEAISTPQGAYSEKANWQLCQLLEISDWFWLCLSQCVLSVNANTWNHQSKDFPCGKSLIRECLKPGEDDLLYAECTKSRCGLKQATYVT